MMLIGELSRETGVHIETIRYYERVGVLPKARRLSNGRRVYGEDDARRLSLVRHARALGFDLNSVQALLDLRDHPDRSCKAASRLAATQLATVEARLGELKELRDVLAHLAGACANGRAADCLVIDNLCSKERYNSTP